MKFGYMPDFNENLFSEIRFAKENFDFLELTLELDKQYDVRKVKSLTKNFEILGHLHWELNLNLKGDIEKILHFVDIYKKLDVKKITIHPSLDKRLKLEILRSNNIRALNQILNYCKNKKIKLLVENDSRVPFSKALEIVNLIKNVSGLGFTFDIGHALLSNKLDKFLKLKYEHVHLHNVIANKDHSLFNDIKKLKNILNKIKSKTVTLEIFENKDKMLEQLRVCKNN
ncbi:MAG: sugar phosphate isomerase/epimerase [Nanoarchaeota archaeon]|nr:sugar phosphate isomerase/epimerase [Nanoarchaeota archaeon]